MNMRIYDIARNGLILIEGWLQADHARCAWGAPIRTPGCGAVFRTKRIGGLSSRWLAAKSGSFCGSTPRAESSMRPASLISRSVIDIDIMIGENTAVGQGVGAAAMRLLAEAALSEPTTPFAIACVRLNNLASQRAFVRAGFHKDREFDDVPNRRHALLVCHRQEAQGE